MTSLTNLDPVFSLPRLTLRLELRPWKELLMSMLYYPFAFDRFSPWLAIYMYMF